jgi:hypothetical protein
MPAHGSYPVNPSKDTGTGFHSDSGGILRHNINVKTLVETGTTNFHPNGS